MWCLEPSAQLLRAVSRSFYLSIAALPAPLRRPVGLAYLLARTSDTLADTAGAPVALRLQALQLFAQMLETGVFTPLPAQLEAATAAERQLLRALPDCLTALQTTPPRERAEIQTVLRHILRGQHLDLTRSWPVTTAAQLDEYIFLVAGSVGAFWTRLCFLHLAHCARLPAAQMETLGVNFGKGLQLVNILRDLPDDLAAGRRYLPGAAPDAAFAHWLSGAWRYLDDAFRYIEALRPWRLRFATLLPWWIGLRTLALLEAAPPQAGSPRVKVPRAEVRRMLALAAGPVCSNALLRQVRRNPRFLLARR